ncbi:MAG: nucleotidyltransferase domain-containing protein [Chloroflexi bacterium]|nr:nucleotidyltransferase domain-containing protein [Chloroflexota bacterium]
MNTDEIRSVAQEIGERFHAERVILFGSHGRGDAGPDSDVDLLVVMDYRGASAAQALHIRLSLEFPWPVDLIVRSLDEIERRVRLRDYFLSDILREGKVLYEPADKRMGLFHCRCSVPSSSGGGRSFLHPSIRASLRY